MRTTPLTHIPLPQKTNSVILVFVFAYGYHSEENRRFGFGHITEHLLIEKIKKETDNINTQGSISDFDISITVETNKKEFERTIEKIKKILTSFTCTQKEITQEKNRILAELEQEKSFGYYVDEEIEKTLIKNPFLYRRSGIAQKEIILRATQKDIAYTIKKLSLLTPYIFAGAHAASKKEKRMYEGVVYSIFGKNSPNSIVPKTPTFQKEKKRIVKNKFLSSDMSHVSLVFNAYTTHESLERRLALGILAELIEKNLKNRAGTHGIYALEKRVVQRHTFGYLSFSTFLPKGNETVLYTLFKKVRDALLASKTVEKDIREIKAEKKKAIIKLWNNNAGRVDWIIDDIVDYGDIVGEKAVLETLSKINKKSIKTVLEEVLKQSPHTLEIK